MPNSYEPVTADAPLSQGDIFTGFPIPVVYFSEPLKQIVLQDGVYRERLVGGDPQTGMQFLAEVEVSPAILLSQSCDARDARRLLLAPLLPFPLKGKDPLEQWEDLNRLATSLTQPTRLYLPDDSDFGFPRRVANLSAIFTAQREVVERLARQGKRKARLRIDSLADLQFRLGVFFSRFARSSAGWPSKSDLELKAAALPMRIKKKKDQIKSKEWSAPRFLVHPK